MQACRTILTILIVGILLACGDGSPLQPLGGVQRPLLQKIYPITSDDWDRMEQLREMYLQEYPNADLCVQHFDEAMYYLYSWYDDDTFQDDYMVSDDHSGINIRMLANDEDFLRNMLMVGFRHMNAR